MKKFLIIVGIVVFFYVVYDICFYRLGIYFDFHPNQEITTNAVVKRKNIYIEKDHQYQNFEIRGVDLGAGMPGHFATDYAIDEATYLRWFQYIKDMGANTIRVYTILSDDFYNAFFKFNVNNDDPLYLIHGLWVNDYIQNSRYDAYAEPFLNTMLDDANTLVDVIHGKKKLSLGSGIGSGSYRHDISKWVLGYILGVEWEAPMVSYTDHKYPDRNSYLGKYMYTTSDATPFEAMLAQVGDRVIEYESKKYKTQRLVAFSNWPTTDPFVYSDSMRLLFEKYAEIDVEHIQTTSQFLAGTFASYHIYPYYPDYLSYDENGNRASFKGTMNSYQAYLKKINDHHTIPVVISEFGVPSSRGMAYKDYHTNRNQGRMTEQEQGQAIIDSIQDMQEVGIRNCIIFTWQDEWFKRTWNTMHGVDLTKTPYWSDYQTNEQYFGLMSFDPGEEQSVSYVDGDISEWTNQDLVSENDSMKLYLKYDEKFIYFMANIPNYHGEKFYIPIDLTPRSGTKSMAGTSLTFDRDVDFVIQIDGKDNSHVFVQEYYDVAKATLGYELWNKNSYVHPPLKNSNVFNPIIMMIDALGSFMKPEMSGDLYYETGVLVYGNANPNANDYNSLADFYIQGDAIEIRIPWNILNFADPSNMVIHDDYYKNYGIEYKMINKMYVGIGTRNISLKPFSLKGWRKNVTYHERLKQSYYMVKNFWKGQ